jgi:hypothetical protein
MDECLAFLFLFGNGSLGNTDKLLGNEVNAAEYRGKY